MLTKTTKILAQQTPLVTQARSSVFQRQVDKQSENPLQQPIWQPSLCANSSRPPQPINAGHNFANIPVLNPVPPLVQPKLTIGQPNDKYEQEADRVADQVMRMPDSSLAASPQQFGSRVIQRTCSTCANEYHTAENEDRPVEQENLCPQCRVQAKSLASQITPLVQRQTDNESEEEDEENNTVQAKPVIQRQADGVGEDEEEEKQTLQTSATPGQAPTATPGVASGISALQGSGQPLSHTTRSFMEPRFGQDFSHVRIHTDSNAARISRQINARAFTVGPNIAFGTGQYQPNSSSGRKLLAHELTHTVQQNGQRLSTAFTGETPDIQNKADKHLIQRAVGETKRDSYAGLFELSKHNPLGGPTFTAPAQYDVKLEFNPYQVVDCKEIDLTQTSVALVNGTPAFSSAADRARALSAAEGTEGLAIDQLSGNKYPYYTRNAAGTVEAGTQLGERSGSGKTEKRKKAFLTDKPGLTTRSAGQKLALDFESCAICTKGTDKDVYYGCVSWGFDIDASNKFTEHPFNLISKGTPSTDFLKAAKKWNDQTVPVATDDLPLPTHKTKQSSMTEADLKTEIKTLKATLKGLAAGHANIPQITFEIKVYEDILGAMAYNKGRGYHERDTKAIQVVVDSTPNGNYDFDTIMKIKRWQVEQGLRGDGRFGPKSKKKFDAIVNAAVKANKAKGFTEEQIKKIQRKVGSNDDGDWGPKTVKRLMVWQEKQILLTPNGVFNFTTQVLMFGFGGF